MPKTKIRLSRKQKALALSPFLVIGGVVLLSLAALVLKPGKGSSSDTATSTEELPIAQLDRAMEAGQPTLAFFHSDNCQQCIDMMQIVAQVYPEFAGSVTLVDINVYDHANQALLKRVGLQYIPTLIFYDQNGNSQVSVGVMQPDELRQVLTALSPGE